LKSPIYYQFMIILAIVLLFFPLFFYRYKIRNAPLPWWLAVVVAFIYGMTSQVILYFVSGGEGQLTPQWIPMFLYFVVLVTGKKKEKQPNKKIEAPQTDFYELNEHELPLE